MTALRLYFVTCNHCARRAGIGFATITDARTDALIRGWHYARRKGTRPPFDLCPHCYQTAGRPPHTPTETAARPGGGTHADADPTAGAVDSVHSRAGAREPSAGTPGEP